MSTIPQTATAPVMTRATISSGFLNRDFPSSTFLTQPDHQRTGPNAVITVAAAGQSLQLIIAPDPEPGDCLCSMPRCRAAVDLEDGAGDVARVVRGQVGDCAGDLGGRREALQWRVVGEQILYETPYASSETHVVGAQVTVFYPADDPQAARLLVFERFFMIPLILALMGQVLLGMAWVAGKLFEMVGGLTARRGPPSG